jgi:hypothetical protein
VSISEEHKSWICPLCNSVSRSSSTSVVPRIRAGRLGNSGSIPGRARDFSVPHGVNVSSGAHPVTYQMDTRGSFSGGKTAKAWKWLFNSI